MTDAPSASSQPRRRGTEYLTGKGLDWGRIDREYRADATPQEIVAAEASAKAMRGRGATPSQSRAAAAAAVSEAFPEAEAG